MKVLLINKYLFAKGGDAVAALGTCNLLQAHAHDVTLWGMDASSGQEPVHGIHLLPNLDLNRTYPLRQQLHISLRLLYSIDAKRHIERVIVQRCPDLVHLHNFAHQISPSILHIFKRHNIPCVMTMHDYKLVCASYSLLAHGVICERCKGGRYLNCLLQKCVKDSRAKSLLNTVEMYLHHSLLHIYDYINTFISPSRFMATKLLEMGFKGNVEYLPNFVNENDYTPEHEAAARTIVYLGRLSKEKGLLTLIAGVMGIDATLKIIGEGPMREVLEKRVADNMVGNIEFLGYKTGDELKSEICKSLFVVLPSECYENNPRSVIEAFALGKPVIGSRIGGIPELVQDGVTGLTFEPGNAEDLRDKIRYLLANPDLVSVMGRAARRLIEQEYNADKHYEKLMLIYQRALDKHK